MRGREKREEEGEVVQPQKGEVIHSQCRGTEIKGEKYV
jgi:hypothetical protein